MLFVICLESLVEIRSAVSEIFPVNDKRRAKVRCWVQNRQRFWGRFLCDFYHPVHNLTGQNQTALLFKKKSSFGRYVGFCVGGSRDSRQNVTFLPPT